MDEWTNCRLCGTGTLVPVLKLGDQVLPGQFHWPSEPPPPKQRVEIVRCTKCGLNQQRYSLDPCLHFDRYWYQSGISGTMRAHLKQLATEAVEMLALSRPFTAGAKVLDIGGNDGYLLDQLPLATPHRTLVDPSNVPLAHPGIKKIHGFFPKALSEQAQYDLIFSAACFYSVNDPRAFVWGIQRSLAKDGLWVCEVADLFALLQQTAYDYWCAEHVALYSAYQMELLAQFANLKLVRIEQNLCNGGSNRYYFTHEDCHAYDNPQWRAQTDALILHGRSLASDGKLHADFAHRVTDSIQATRAYLSTLMDDGETVHLLGASTKGGVVLQASGVTDFPELCLASDRDPRKEGLLIPGTGIVIHSEAESRAAKPDAYLVGPWHLRDELIARETAAGAKVDLIFPLPHFEVVSLNT